MWDYVLLTKEIYSFYIAPCNGLQGAVAQYAANQTRANPFSLFEKCTGFFYLAFFPSEGRSIMVQCLAWGHRCRDWDSYPHSADQRHQSLSPVLLSAKPWHAKNNTISKWEGLTCQGWIFLALPRSQDHYGLTRWKRKHQFPLELWSHDN